MKKYLKQSIILHIVMFILMVFDLPGFWRKDMTLGQTPIIVDLSQVKISEMTNLPAKAEFGEEDHKATVEEHKPIEQYSKDEPEEEPQKTEPEPEPEETPQEVKQDYLEPPAPEKKPEQKPEQKPDPKPTPKQPPVPEAKPKPKPQNKPKDKPQPKKDQEKSKVRSNALKSLMQEIDNNKNLDIGDKTQNAMIKEGTEVKNMGIEGGNSNGSYFSELSISETDAIASLLSQNWQLDPGAMNIDTMIVPIRVELGRDGSIRNIEFLEQGRYNSDPSYRSVAESARRAIYATQQAFREVFGVKYADRYEVWQTLKLKFNPLNKRVE